MKTPRYQALQQQFNMSYTHVRIAWEACIAAIKETGYSPSSKLENRLADVAARNGVPHVDAKPFALEVMDACRKTSVRPPEEPDADGYLSDRFEQR